jgi:hypothetical protein
MRWKALVFLVSCGAYVPLVIGGHQHPEELNLATYLAWTALTAMLSYSAWVQKFEGWSLQLGFFVGNSTMALLGLCQGGYTFNLGPGESVVLYGLIGTVAFATIRWFQGHTEDAPPIIYRGAVLSDILSFWPAVKQYLGENDPPSDLTLLGFIMFLCGIVLSIIFVEKPLQKFFTDPEVFKTEYGKGKTVLSVFEPSFFSIENVILLPLVIYHMTH